MYIKSKLFVTMLFISMVRSHLRCNMNQHVMAALHSYHYTSGDKHKSSGKRKAIIDVQLSTKDDIEKPSPHKVLPRTNSDNIGLVSNDPSASPYKSKAEHSDRSLASTTSDTQHVVTEKVAMPTVNVDSYKPPTLVNNDFNDLGPQYFRHSFLEPGYIASGYNLISNASICALPRFCHSEEYDDPIV